jgi:hypothetical protein
VISPRAGPGRGTRRHCSRLRSQPPGSGYQLAAPFPSFLGPHVSPVARPAFLQQEERGRMPDLPDVSPSATKRRGELDSLADLRGSRSVREPGDPSGRGTRMGCPIFIRANKKSMFRTARYLTVATQRLISRFRSSRTRPSHGILNPTSPCRDRRGFPLEDQVRGECSIQPDE